MTYKYTLEGTSAAPALSACLHELSTAAQPAPNGASAGTSLVPLREDQVRTVPGRVIFIQNMFSAAASFSV